MSSYTSYINDRAWRLRNFFTQAQSGDAPDSPIQTTQLNESVIEIDQPEGGQDRNRYALIYGGSGSLGSKCIFDLKAAGWWVASVDFNANIHADINVLLLQEEDPTKHEVHITVALKSILGTRRLELIFCVTQGFQDGGVYDNLLKVGVEMWQEHVIPSMICASLAAKFLKKNGLMVLISSWSVLKPRGDMLAYSVANNAVVHLTKCLATLESGMPRQSTVVCLLPRYLDTALERNVYNHVDMDNFTPLQYITDLVISWVNKKDLPLNGSLCQLVTSNFVTECIILQ